MRSSASSASKSGSLWRGAPIAVCTHGARSRATSTRRSIQRASTRCFQKTSRYERQSRPRLDLTHVETRAARTYCYRVLPRRARGVFTRGRALWWPRPLESSALAACAKALEGVHDFTAFTPTDTDHVRFERHVIYAEWRAAGETLEFWIEADTFMRHMNRVLVGTMLEVASGQRTPAEFERLLEGAPRTQAGPTAPAHGLALAAVSYP